MMRILFSNDDGLHAEGLWQAWRAFPTAERHVVAPMHNQSGASHAFTLRSTLRVEEREVEGGEGLAVDGFPADTVKFAITRAARPFDWVISGINHGENGGVANFYSGTVAGAREGALWGIPSVSISIWSERPGAYEAASDFLGTWIPRWHEALQEQPVRPFFLNVNFPDCDPQQIEGIRVCNQSQAMFLDEYLPEDEGGQTVYRLGPAWKNLSAIVPGTDDHATKNRLVSVTPLSLDASAPETQDWLRSVGGLE